MSLTAITIIQCTDLTIGTWHRIAAKTGTHDLIAYTAEGSQVLTWYIYSEGFGFRMDLPFNTIERVDLSTSNSSPGSAMATIMLSQCPNFYMESNAEQGRQSPASHALLRAGGMVMSKRSPLLVNQLQLPLDPFAHATRVRVQSQDRQDEDERHDHS